MLYGQITTINALSKTKVTVSTSLKASYDSELAHEFDSKKRSHFKQNVYSLSYNVPFKFSSFSSFLQFPVLPRVPFLLEFHRENV